MINLIQLLIGFVEIVFTEEGLGAARTASIEHIEGRGNNYVADWSPPVDPDTRTYDAVYQSNRPNSGTLRANRDSGIYLILDRDANRAYVGLTHNFSHRFFNGNPRHPRGCQPNCRCHGHITTTLDTCTSHIIINSNNGFSVYLLDEIPFRGNRIGQAEIEWYYILREHGFDMVNAIWALGNKGHVRRPIISLDLKNTRYHFFASITEAANTLFGPGTNPGWVNQTISINGIVPQSNHVRGYIHRYATLDENREYTEAIDVGEMINNTDSITTWRWGRNGEVVDFEDRCRGCRGGEKHTNRPRIIWEGGPLSSTEISHLEATMKGAYKPTRKSRFSGVRWKISANPPGWQYAYKRLNSPIFQTGPLAKWKKPVVLFGYIIKKNDLYPALDREERILREDWQNENSGKVHNSNAKLINLCQPWRFINGEYFTDWTDGKTGLLRVLIFYGSILSLLTEAMFQLFG